MIHPMGVGQTAGFLGGVAARMLSHRDTGDWARVILDRC